MSETKPDGGISRRSFLKILGVTGAAAVGRSLVKALAADPPVENSESVGNTPANTMSEKKEQIDSLPDYDLLPDKHGLISTPLAKVSAPVEGGVVVSPGTPIGLTIHFCEKYYSNGEGGCGLKDGKGKGLGNIRLTFKIFGEEDEEVDLGRELVYADRDFVWHEGDRVLCKFPTENWGKPEIKHNINTIGDKKTLVLNVVVPRLQGSPPLRVKGDEELNA